MQIDRRAAIAAATALPAAALAVSPALASPGFPSVYNVRDFGAAGDMIVDDAGAIQAAIDACGVAGGTVYFPAGRYLINAGLRISSNPNTEVIELVGEGRPGVFGYYGIGSALIVTNNGVTGITVDFGRHRTVGPAIRRLHVIQKPGSPNGNGILIKETETCIFEDVTCSDYIGGYGLCFDGGPEGGNAQYAQLVNFSAGDCLYGLKTHNLGANGFRLFGGYFCGQGTTPRAGSVAISIESGGTNRIFGAVIQGWETGAYCNGEGDEFHGPRFEYCNTCLRFGPNAHGFSLFGGTFSNHILGGGGPSVGIQIDAGASIGLLIPTGIASVAHEIINNGANVKIPFWP